MSGHRLFIQIGNATTGEILENQIIDEEFALIDMLRIALDDLHAKYRARYPVGLRTSGSPIIVN